MTKEKFKSDHRNFFICKKCGDIVDKNNVSYNQVHDNGYMNECKACNYISRNKNRLSKIDIKTNDLKLRDKIIIPYQDIKQKEYEYLIKRKA